MGAMEFGDAVDRSSRVKTAADAFRVAVDDARFYHGHGGYTGSIAEKHAFVMIDPKPHVGRGSVIVDSWDDKPHKVKRPRSFKGALPTKGEAADIAQFLMMTDHPKVADKWGPAGCIEYRAMGGRVVAGWYFFGLASS